MKKIIVLMIMNIGFAQDFTVDGDLNVSGNKVLNVADPTAETDAVNLRTLNEISGMDVERIYKFENFSNSTSPWSITVPSGKVWLIRLFFGYLYINGYYVGNVGTNVPLYLFEGDIITGGSPNSDGSSNAALFNIYEYTPASSGTAYGMDYIEP